MRDQAAENCMPMYTQVCLGLRWEGVHKKISLL